MTPPTYAELRRLLAKYPETPERRVVEALLRDAEAGRKLREACRGVHVATRGPLGGLTDEEFYEAQAAYDREVGT